MIFIQEHQTTTKYNTKINNLISYVKFNKKKQYNFKIQKTFVNKLKHIKIHLYI